jgi:hypothetical protein
MNRMRTMLTIAATSGIICFAQQNEVKPQRLKSGRVILPKNFGPMITPNMPNEKGFVFSYQTNIRLDDLKSLEQEAMEIWQDLRPEFEKVPGITFALLQADEQPRGMFIQEFSSYKFVIERKPDGTWVWLKNKPTVGQ